MASAPHPLSRGLDGTGCFAEVAVAALQVPPSVLDVRFAPVQRTKAHVQSDGVRRSLLRLGDDRAQKPAIAEQIVVSGVPCELARVAHLGPVSRRESWPDPPRRVAPASQHAHGKTKGRAVIETRSIMAAPPGPLIDCP